MAVVNINRNIAILIFAMGTSKIEDFTIKQNRIAQLTKAFSHPARVAIIELLLSKNSCICGDIVDELPLSQSTVSQHLKELKEVGIIKGDVLGTKVCYCINPDVWNEFSERMNDLLNKLKPIKKCC